MLTARETREEGLKGGMLVGDAPLPAPQKPQGRGMVWDEDRPINW